jgi:hypothetical protein
MFWTGFGEVSVSNKPNNKIDKAVILLDETAPEETIPSICDFKLIPTTPSASYCLMSSKITPGGTNEFGGDEIPLVTTKGTIFVVNADNEIVLEKYIDPLINWQDTADILTNKGIHKVWSEKFYFTKEPVSQEEFSYNGAWNSLHTFEFTEEDF